MNFIEIELLKKQYLDEINRAMSFTEEEFDAIKNIIVFRQYKKGTILLKEGQFSMVNYTLVKGCFKSYYVIDGEEIITAFYTENDNFTPTCINTKKPSEHYLSCLEDCLVSLSNPEIEKMMFDKFPRFEKLCRIYAEELLAKNQVEFDMFKTSTPEDRYLKLLESKPELFQRVPQYLIASYLGMKPQSLSRIRKRLIKGEMREHKVAFN